MTTSLRSRDDKRAERLITPLLGFTLGLLFLVILGLRGDWAEGAISFAIMAVYSSVLLVLGRRSETIGLLGGDVTDERRREISIKAVAFTGQVLVLIIVAMFVWELAHGHDTTPWAALGAIGGVTFVAATGWYSRHT